jgi:hypothetical protein
MPPVCTLCRRPDRAEIDALLVVPTEPLRNIAARFGTSPATLLRHKEHLPRALVLTAEGRELTRADTLTAHVQEIRAHADRLRGQAEATGDIRTALMALKLMNDVVETLLKAQTADREHSGTGHVQEMQKEAARLAELTGVPAEEILETAAKLANPPGLTRRGDHGAN